MTAPLATDSARLAEIRAVTDNYFFWQGLRWVPLGSALLVMSLVLNSVVPLPEAVQDWILIPVLGLALVASNAIGSYYRRSFGRVRGIPGAHSRRSAIKWFVVYPLMLASLPIDMIFAPPVFVTGLVWGLGILAYWYSTGRGRLHYVAASLIFIALTVAPLFGVQNGKSLVATFIGLVGVVYIVGGVLDHFALRRILAPVPDET